MKFLLLHYVDETNEMDAEESREDQALLASWLEDTIARGVNLQGSYLQPSRNAATVRTRDGEFLAHRRPVRRDEGADRRLRHHRMRGPAEALRVASAHPTTRHGTIEIRPFPAE